MINRKCGNKTGQLRVQIKACMCSLSEGQIQTDSVMEKFCFVKGYHHLLLNNVVYHHLLLNDVVYHHLLLNDVVVVIVVVVIIADIVVIIVIVVIAFLEK